MKYEFLIINRFYAKYDSQISKRFLCRMRFSNYQAILSYMIFSNCWAILCEIWFSNCQTILDEMWYSNYFMWNVIFDLSSDSMRNLICFWFVNRLYVKRTGSNECNKLSVAKTISSHFLWHKSRTSDIFIIIFVYCQLYTFIC